MFDKVRMCYQIVKMQKNGLKAFVENKDAKMGGQQAGKVVGLAVIAILVGTVFVEGVRLIAAANTTNLTATEIILLGVTGLIFFVALIWLVLEYAGIV